MAGPNDFTNQNIQDTYQRVLQTDGQNIFDGTGSAFNLTNNISITASHAQQAVTASHALFAISASHEITHELSTSYSQTADSASGNFHIGNNIYLNNATGQIFQNGVLMLTLQSSGQILPHYNMRTSDGKGIAFGAGSDYTIQHNSTTAGETKLAIKEGGNTRYIYGIGGHLTASSGVNIQVTEEGEFRGGSANITNITASNISSSGYVLTNELRGGGDEISLNVLGSITASGNISATGHVSASAFLISGSDGSVQIKTIVGHDGIGNGKVIIQPEAVNESGLIGEIVDGAYSLVVASSSGNTKQLIYSDTGHSELSIRSGETGNSQIVFNENGTPQYILGSAGADDSFQIRNSSYMTGGSSFIRMFSGSGFNQGIAIGPTGSNDAGSGHFHLTASGNISASGIGTFDGLNIDPAAPGCKTTITHQGVIVKETDSNLTAAKLYSNTQMGVLDLNYAGGNTNGIQLAAVGDCFINPIAGGLMVGAGPSPSDPWMPDNTMLFVHGNISSSGVLYANHISTGSGELSENYISITGSTSVFGNVTASGHISASGHLYGSHATITGTGSFLSADISSTIDSTGTTSQAALRVAGGLSVAKKTTTKHLVVSQDFAVSNNVILCDNIVDSIMMIGTVITDINQTGDLNQTGNIFTSGHISASGDISSSGVLYVNHISTGSGELSENYISITGSTSIQGNLTASGNFKAAGDISSSGTITADIFNATGAKQYKLNGDKALYLDSTNIYVGHHEHKTYITSSGIVDITGNITASGQISASGTISGLAGHTQHDLNDVTTGTSGSGDIVKFGTGTSVPGKIYHYKSDGSWELAVCTGISTCDGMLAVALGENPDVDGMLLRGMCTLHTIQGSQTVGDVLYLSETAGGTADCVAPSAQNEVVRIIGYNLHASSKQIWFCPDNTWVEIA